MSSGVRNLRAMFEQNAASSPEPRGRSPAGSVSDDNNSRPTSKVRASFVSVVPPTALFQPDLGVSKGTASNSTMAHRRESFSISQDQPDDIAELKKLISEQKEERTKSIAVAETIPEQAVASRESSVGPPPITDTPAGELNLGTIMKGSDFPDSAEPQDTPVRQSVQEPVFEPTPVELDEPAAAPAPVQDTPAHNPDKPVTGAQEEVSLKPANPIDAAAVAGGDALPAPAEDLRPQPAAEAAVEPSEATVETPETVTETPAEAPVTPVDAPATPVETKATESPKTATSKAATPKAATPKPRANGTPVKAKTETKKPAAISTTKASTSKTAPAKSPLPPRSAKSPLPPRTTAKAPTTPKRVAAPPASKPAVPAVTKPAAKPATAREPTKPTARASSAAAPTAAARAKTAASATEAKKPAAPKAKDSATTSPPGFKKPKPKSPTRPAALPSRLIAPTAASVAKHGEEPAKPAKKPATTTRPASKTAGTIKPPSRPAAPPAATAKRPESRTSTAGGGGFLERMMRPTASSAKKTHDKPMSPPRKTGAAKPGVLQKGKKKVEEAVAKVKDAVTANGHADEHHDVDASENAAPKTSGSAELADPFVESAPEPKNEPIQEGSGEVVPEPIKEEPKEESAQAEAAAQEPESSMVELQTPNFKSDVVR